MRTPHLVLLFLVGCGSVPESAPNAARTRTASPEVDLDGLADPVDSGLPESEAWDPTSRAFSACVTEADCDPGSACTTVQGYGGAYCAPACEPGGDGDECDSEGVLGVDTFCSTAGRCVRACGEPDSCPDALDCQDAAAFPAPVCAGEVAGVAGYYGTCTHPMTDGPDCPESSSCFGGALIGVEDGVCLPWCDDGTCEPVPETAVGVSPVCYDVGLEHPVCALICSPGSSTCPPAQECTDLGGLGLCVPEGASF